MSVELALAFACCRWPRSKAGHARVRSAAGEADWERFLGIVSRNRISALAHDALDGAGVRLPPSIAAQLARGQSNTAFTSLALARESIRLQRAFDTAGLPALIVKGAPMAMLAYGDLGRKESKDIDLLTDESLVLAARGLLENSGYRLSAPAGLDDAQFARWIRHSTEAAFHHHETGITTELHWRLVDNDLLLAGVGLASEVQVVSFGAGTVKTLADAPLFAYLCVHGASHNWSRLKWLADLGAFVGNRSAHEVEGLYHKACSFGAERPAALALLLCERMLALQLSPELEKELTGNKVIAALMANVLASLEFGAGMSEHSEYTQPWWRARIARFLFGRGMAHLGRELHNAWTSPSDHAKIAVPPRLSFLYHFLRGPLWLYRAGMRIGRKRS